MTVTVGAAVVAAFPVGVIEREGEADIFQRMQSTVDRIQRDLGVGAPHAVGHRLYGGVVRCFEQGAVDFRALQGYFQAGFAADRFEVSEFV